MTLKLATHERFLMLSSHVVDDVPDDAGGELLRALSSACMETIRAMRGAGDDATARFAINRARDALISAGKEKA